MMLTDMAKYMAKKMMMWGYKNEDDGVKGCFCGNYATKNGGQADPDEGGQPDGDTLSEQTALAVLVAGG